MRGMWALPLLLLVLASRRVVASLEAEDIAFVAANWDETHRECVVASARALHRSAPVAELVAIRDRCVEMRHRCDMLLGLSSRPAPRTRELWVRAEQTRLELESVIVDAS